MSSEPIQATEGGVRLRIHAQPGAKRTEVIGIHGDAIKIRVHAPPVEGKANDELLRFLAQLLKINRQHIELTAGLTSRSKTFEARGVGVSEARSLILKV